jgi:beta-lactamase regulating signal transducer with metallopeptidase domain
MILGSDMNDTNEQAENRRAHFAESGEWARHYSNVRMTVITFVVTACVAILALKWDADVEKKMPAAPSQGSAPTTVEAAAKTEKRVRAEVVANSVALLWILGSLVFQGFTYYTLRRMTSQLKHRGQMRMPEDPAVLPACPEFDYPSLTIPLISALFVYCLLRTSVGNVVSPFFSVLIYLLLVESAVLPFIFYRLFAPIAQKKNSKKQPQGKPTEKT